MKKIATLLATLATGALFTFSAHAVDTVTFPGYAHGSETVTATLTPPNGPVTITAGAGGFLTSVNGGPSFESYCIDLYQTLTFGTAYTDYFSTGAHTFANANAYADLGRLFGVAGLVNTSVAEAAFQIAVWEIAYETSGAYSLSTGSATFAGGTAAASGALTLASSWLASLGQATSTAAISVLESRVHQDVVFAPIPEPSTYALMAIGLLGLGFIARRRQQA